MSLLSYRFGARFLALSSAYDRELRQLSKKISKELGFNFVHEGVYMVQTGPCFETVAECRMARLMGADVLGGLYIVWRASWRRCARWVIYSEARLMAQMR